MSTNISVCARGQSGVLSGSGGLWWEANVLHQFIFKQETLKRQIPADGKRDSGAQGSWHLRRRRKDRTLERFEYIVDGGRLDKEDRAENNGVCIFWRALPQGESPTLSPGVWRLWVLENFQRRKDEHFFYLMIPDSCDQTAGGSGTFVSALHMSLCCRRLDFSVAAAKLGLATPRAPGINSWFKHRRWGCRRLHERLEASLA